MAEVAQELIQQKRGSLTKELVPAPASDDQWHDWNMMVFSRSGGRRFLYVPVDAAEVAKTQLPKLREQIEALGKTPPGELTAEQAEGLRRLGAEVEACHEAISKVPPCFNKDALEWEFDRGR